MRTAVRTLLPPAAGFSLVLGLALMVSAGASSAPASRLHRRVTAYLGALYRGDQVAASAYREDQDPRVESERARGLRGVTFFLVEQQLAAGGAEAGVHVVWLSGGNQVLREEVETWRRRAGGDWALWALDGGPPGIFR